MIWRVLLCLAVPAAVAGWAWGRLPDEGDAIRAVAQRHVAAMAAAGQGAAETDCVGRPGSGPGVWIAVICRSGAGAARIYRLDRRGRILPPGAPSA
ncbi:hypothetical protein OCGS_0835 [Oceaniovalibus guishaninsula JLT2003]|uniref:Uncharacterized protein n=1 Tax=Oceaniovalibus guishaninsula JLT2003 TaxID=1231392 RepID=K2I817_9RHOB|nr:hypothetical protein [Oceaniovalibus guishaninsula]EKE45140.1 hypothetical protein OCGS_0835 [Oceaniovalibus guishaninsula JLT2003]